MVITAAIKPRAISKNQTLCFFFGRESDQLPPESKFRISFSFCLKLSIVVCFRESISKPYLTYMFDSTRAALLIMLHF